jgi:hypothetical protein
MYLASGFDSTMTDFPKAHPLLLEAALKIRPALNQATRWP